MSFEWDRVEYSTILDNLGVDSGMELDDGDELRVGGEYVFVRATPVVALRLGSWLDPDRRSRPNASADRELKGLFWPGSDEIQVAIGLGIVFSSLQVDFAVDFSDLVDTVSLSTIFSF